MSQAAVAHDISRLEELFRILEEAPGIYRHWQDLAEKCGAMGRQAHDARLATRMLTPTITQIL